MLIHQNHNHCEHKELKFCQSCNVVYCGKCSNEWGKFTTPSNPYIPTIVPLKNDPPWSLPNITFCQNNA